MNKFFKSALAIAALVTAFALQSCGRVDAGHEAVIANDYGTDKGVSDVTLITGRYFYNPWSQTVYEYPTHLVVTDYQPFSINASDGSEFHVDPTLTSSLRPGSTPGIVRKYRKDMDAILETVMYNNIKEAFRIGMNDFTTDQIVSKRGLYEARVKAILDSTIKADGFVAMQLTSGLTYPASITRAIESKNEAVQKAQQVENSLRESEALRKRKILEATGDAEANRIRQASITPMTLKQLQLDNERLFIQKWNGATPLYGTAPTLFKNVN